MIDDMAHCDEPERYMMKKRSYSAKTGANIFLLRGRFATIRAKKLRYWYKNCGKPTRLQVFYVFARWHQRKCEVMI
jgi:hypothetical protein